MLETDCAVIQGKKNILVQDVDLIVTFLYNSPVNNTQKAVLETAGVTASLILADRPLNVKHR